MSKHTPTVITGDDLVDRIERDADNQRPSDYGVRAGKSAYLVTWPDHVTLPKFNGDANYMGVVGRATTLAELKKIAKRHGADAYGA